MEAVSVCLGSKWLTTQNHHLRCGRDSSSYTRTKECLDIFPQMQVVIWMIKSVKNLKDKVDGLI